MGVRTLHLRRKALLLGTLAFIVAGSFFVWHHQLRRHADEQEALMRSIAHLGGRFSLDADFLDPPEYGPPRWLKQLVGERLFAHVVSVNLGTTAVDDLLLERLGMLRHLQSLGVWQTHISDAGVTALARLAELETLDLSETDITDDGLRRLAWLPRMRTLVIGSSRLTDEGLTHLKKFSKLEMLCVVGDQFSGSAKTNLQRALPETTVVFVPLPKVAGEANRDPTQARPPMPAKAPESPAAPEQKLPPARATIT